MFLQASVPWFSAERVLRFALFVPKGWMKVMLAQPVNSNTRQAKRAAKKTTKEGRSCRSFNEEYRFDEGA